MTRSLAQLLERLRTSPIDWILFGASLLLVAAGLVTMNSFSGENYFFQRQLIWSLAGVTLFLVLSFIDFRFLRRTWVIVTLFIATSAILFLILTLGEIVKGAQNRFDFGLFSLQPSDPAKLVVLLLLAKYFSRRHVEIAHVRHILVSGVYTLIIFILVLLQPDFGSALIIFMLWIGIILISGVSKKHLAAIGVIALLSFGGMWTAVFEDYQKQRILTFIHPLTDLQGAGYNAYQSTVAVGSGGFFGKGVGFGTQSRLEFLPEYETDFIFAAFAEEWGFIGVLLLYALFIIVIWRILESATKGASNFEMLYGTGLAILFMSNFIVHIGINIGLLPVTGTTLPFMSYGGSHLLTEFVGLGILMGMLRYNRPVHRDEIKYEIPGVT